VGATVQDLRDQLRYDFSDLSHVVAAYFAIQLEPLKVHVWTLLDAWDASTEQALAAGECRLMQSFPGIDFDSTTVHLRGREAVQFIPDGAIPIKLSRPDVYRFFQDALRAPIHARL
jgi:hypothetical protein